jgi:hypothetical protein
MKTGIEKFKNVFNDKTCNQIVKYIEDNLEQAKDFDFYDKDNNVICQELYPTKGSELDNTIYKVINQICSLYRKKYSHFTANGDTDYQLRKISGKTREHVDGVTSDYPSPRNISIIIGLNSDYEEGQFHFPYQDFTTTVKRGEAIAFPVYFMYPHSVDAPIGFRYTINTWMVGD